MPVALVSSASISGTEDPSSFLSFSARLSSLSGFVAGLSSVGFGIASPEQAAEVAGFADGVIVGSAIVRMIGKLGESDETAPKVGAFVKTLVDATKGKS